MSSLRNHRIRMALDASEVGVLLNIFNSSSPRIYKGMALQAECALFFGDELQDISNLSLATLEFKETANREGSPITSVTVAAADMNILLNQTDWDTNRAANCHILFELSDAIMNAFTIGTENEKEFWCTISALTTDSPARKITLGSGVVTVVISGGQATASSVPTGDPLYYTAAQCDARFGSNVLKVVNDPGITFALKSDNGLFMRVWGVNDDGSEMNTVVPLAP